ncbi:MAG: type II secretion system F family protein, partial [Candidatus Omnitrophota bacterium]
VRLLQARGLLVISVEEAKAPRAPKKKPKKLHKKARIDDLIIFARQLSVLLEAGVPILRAMQVLTEQVSSRVLRDACKNIDEDLKAGSSLRDAIAKYPRIFSQMWVDLVETGEATGQLAFVLKKLADYLNEIWSLQKKVIAALIYPAILILVALAAVFIFMYKVIPVFAGIYKGIGKLPALTQTVIDISDGITQHFFKIVIGVTVTIFILRKYVKTEKGKRQLDALKLRMPVAGPLFLSIAIERFATSLAMMLKGGVSIIHALEIAVKSAGNVVIEEELEKVRLSVLQGKPISAPMVDSGYFPPMVTQMIAVGEESGRLAQLLEEVSKFYVEDIENKVTKLVSLLEPAILVVMGGVIGVLVAAMYLPIFSMGSAVSGK